MSDLVKRLRRTLCLEHGCYEAGLEAADCIEQQDREIAELKRRLKRWESAPVVAWHYIDGDGCGTGDVQFSEPVLDPMIGSYQELIARHTEE